MKLIYWISVAILLWYPMMVSAMGAPSSTAWLAMTPTAVLRGLNIPKTTPTEKILIKMPRTIESGLSVSIEVVSHVPNTESLCIIASDNPFPLVSCFQFSALVAPKISTRIRIGQTSQILAIVKAKNQYYVAQQSIQVSQGGCSPAQNEKARPTIGTSSLRLKDNGNTTVGYVRVDHLMPRPTDTKTYLTTHFVRQIQWKANGQIALTAILGPSMTDHPYMMVTFNRKPLNVSVIWKDQAGKQGIIQ